MRRHLKRNLAIATAVAAVLAALLIVILSGGGSHHGDRAPTQTSASGELALSARYLGMSVGELRGRLRAGRTLASVARSSAGRSERGLVEAILAPKVVQIESEHLPRAAERARIARLRARLEAQLERRRRPRDLAAAARYLGLKPAEVLARLDRGRTLAQIAASQQGRSVAGLRQALIEARRARYRHYLAAGLLSARQERAALKGVRARVEAELAG